MKKLLPRIRSAWRHLRQWWHRHEPALRRWLHPRLPFLKRQWRRLARLVYVATALVLVALTIVYLVARLWLPTIVDKKPEIEAWLSQKSAHQVRIERLETFWRGLYPGVRLTRVRVYAGGRTVPAVRLRELHVSLDWVPLLWGEVRIDRLRVVGPQLSFERLRDGRFRVTGFEPVTAGADPADGEDFVDWLFRQRRLEIADGELQWVDHRDPGRVLYFKAANLTLDNRGDRHRLEFRAAFPETLCRDCALVADVRGNPFRQEAWQGRLQLRAVGLDVGALPAILGERLPRGLAGQFSLDLDSRWRDGLVQQVRGHVRAADLRLPARDLAAPVPVRQVSGMVRWRVRDSGWALEVSELRLGLAGHAWETGRLAMAFSADGGEFELQRLDLGDVTALAGALRPGPGDNGERLRAGLGLLAKIRPAGQLADLRAHWRGPIASPADFRFESDVLRLASEPFGNTPGVRNLTGRVSLHPNGGEFLLDSTRLAVQLPRYFEKPLEADRAGGRFRLVRHPDHWLLDGEDMELEHSDAAGRGRMLLRLPADRTQQPHLKLRVEFRNGNGAHAARYYPKNIPPATLVWLKRSIVSGRVLDGTLLYDGQAKDFPFHQGHGRFEIRGRATDLVYAYLPDWPPLTSATAELTIDNARVAVRGAGRVGDLQVDDIRVDTAFVGDRTVRVGLRAHGPFDGFLRTLQEAKPAPGQTWKAVVPPTARGRGLGELNLKVEIPFAHQPAKIAGDYSLREATLFLPGANVSLEALNGKIGFTENGPGTGRLQGRLFGGDATVEIISPRPGELQVGAHGVVKAPGLAPVLGPAMAGGISGEAPWEATFRLRRGVPEFQAQADLPGLKMTLPAPFNRPDGLTRERLAVRTLTADRRQHHVELRAGQDLHGRLLFVNDNQGWRFARGGVAFGSPRTALPPAPGLHLQARVKALDLDAWNRFRRPGDGGDLPAIVQRLSVEIGALDTLGRRFGRTALDLVRTARGWQGTVQGSTAGGRLRVDSLTAPRRVELELAHLRLPQARPGAAARPAETGDPRRLPSLRLRAQELIWKELRLGRLEIDAEPLADGWSLGRLVLSRPEAKFTSSGNWRVVEGRHQSAVDLAIHSDNAGETLAAFGIRDQLDRGKVDIRARVTWPGPPAAFSPRTVRGEVELKAEKGSFVQLKEGAGRLIGILDVTSILRVLTLDLNPIFGRGFVYENAEGRITLDGGNAYTRDLKLKGTVARVSVDGRIGLAKEDFDLRIIIEPQISGTVTTATWGLFGPGVAAAVLAFQKIFKKQISAGTRITYVVKGGWKDPKIDKLLPKTAEPAGDKPAE